MCVSKCSSETENIFSTVLNAGRSIDSSSENLSRKEEEERRPGSRFPLSLPINTPLLIRAAWSCSNSFFNPRGEMLFRKPLCDDTFPYFFLSLSFSLEKILPSLSSFTCQIDRLVKLSRERERERERKKACVDRRNYNNLGVWLGLALKLPAFDRDSRQPRMMGKI